VGVLEAMNKAGESGIVTGFQEEDIILLEMISRQVAVSLDLCRQREEQLLSEKQVRDVGEGDVALSEAAAIGAATLLNAPHLTKQLLSAKDTEIASSRRTDEEIQLYIRANDRWARVVLCCRRRRHSHQLGQQPTSGTV